MKLSRTVFYRCLMLACVLFLGARSNSWAVTNTTIYGYLNDPFDTGANCPQSCTKGMPEWSVSEPYCNLWVKDVPLGYQPAKGPEVALSLAYKQRADTLANPVAGLGKFKNVWSWPWKRISAGEEESLFWKWFPVENVEYTNIVVGSSLNEFSFGVHWNCGWLSFCATNGDKAQILLPGGGVADFNAADGRDFISNTRLQIYGGVFRIIAPDGSTNLYGMKATVDNYPRFYLTEISDRTGQKLTLQYDDQGSNPSHARLRHVIDADGRTNTLRYNSEVASTFWGGSPSAYSPNLVAFVVDAFRRTNWFDYNADGQLVKVRDVVGIESSFTYGASNWMSSLVTPYGTTTFDTSQNSETNDIRSLKVTDAGGGSHLWVFRGDLSEIYGDRANSFYWGPRQYALLTNTADLKNLDAGEYVRAARKIWEPASAQAHSLLLKQWEFSPDGVNPGQQTDHFYTRDGSGEVEQLLPSKVERFLPDSTTWFQEMQRDYYGVVTNTVGSYTEPGGGVGPRANRFDYSLDGFNLTAVYDAEDNQVLGVTYADRLPVVVTDVLNQSNRFTYNASGQLTSATRPSGLVTTNIYFASGEYAGWLDRTVDYIGGVAQRTNSFTYTNGLVFTQTDERGAVMTNTWDALGRLTSVRDGLGTVTNIYDKLDLIRTVDRMGFTNGFVYDAMRRLRDTYDSLGRKTHYEYCTCGALESVTDADNKTTTLTYDAGGRNIGRYHADGYWVTNELNKLGQIVTTTDSAGASVTHVYNNQGLLYQTLNAWGNVGLATFDIHDRVITQTDANNVTVTNAYDVAGRLLVRDTPANGAQESFGYTFNVPGLTSHTNALTNTTWFGYDAYGRKTAETNANQEVNRFAYDADGALRTLTDGLNHVTTWRHDVFGRVTNKVDHLGTNVFIYGYDANSRLATRITPAKGATGYGYDAVGNLTGVNYPVSADLTLQYDVLNRLTNLVSAGLFTNAYAYTAAGQLATEDGPWANDTVSYNYENRLRTRMSLQQSVGIWSVTNVWEAATKRLMGVSSAAGSFGYQYHSVHATRVSQLDLPGGAHIVNSYDDLARLTETRLNNSSGVPVNSHSYEINIGDQRTKQTRKDGSFVDYDYDPIGQLKTARAKEVDAITDRLHEQFGFGYDAAGNLQQRTNNALAQTFNVNAVNELTTRTRAGTLTVSGETSGLATNVTVNGANAALYADFGFAKDGFADGTNTFTAIAESTNGVLNTNVLSVSLPATQSFAYDANGNLTSDGKRGLEYDDENQLASVTQTNQFKKEFAYDGLRRMRVRKEFAWVGGAWTQTNETRFIYDGLVIIQTRDTDNAPKLSFTRGLDLSGSLQGAGGTGGLLAMTDHVTTSSLLKTSLYHSDGNGNVTCLISTNGLIVGKALFDPFGAMLAKSGPQANVNPLWFSSQLYDADTGYSHYLYRVYSADLQRWLTKDPIEELGGINLYGFVFNDPVRLVDPLGEAASDQIADPWIKQVHAGRDMLMSNGTGWGSILWNTCVGSFATLGESIPDALKAGDATGSVSGDPNAGVVDWTLAVVQDGGRAATVVSTAGGAAAKVTTAARVASGGVAPAAAVTQAAGGLVSANVRAFLKGEKTLCDLTAAERAQAIRGFEQAAQEAKSAADAAYQQARAAALRGERAPPGSIIEWRKNFKQK